MKDWALVALLIPLGAMALGLFGFFGMQRVIWDRAYDQALSKYRVAFVHRDDPGGANVFPLYQEYEEAEKQLESMQTEDPERLKRFKELQVCGLSLKGYRDLKANGFVTSRFEKAAAACAQ
ncbi:hypothetical protein P8935_15460 [Telmatobacter sp. DSM 110680]|uniref:Uncharacterized protein n=1 Tax=Telmatobacter sp. DSM 110680 TaxID=3036704 RepID=A0AAU7DFC6_9BACT